jgi:hypothetical protein
MARATPGQEEATRARSPTRWGLMRLERWFAFSASIHGCVRSPDRSAQSEPDPLADTLVGGDRTAHDGLKVDRSTVPWPTVASLDPGMGEVPGAYGPMANRDAPWRGAPVSQGAP